MPAFFFLDCLILLLEKKGSEPLFRRSFSKRSCLPSLTSKREMRRTLRMSVANVTLIERLLDRRAPEWNIERKTTFNWLYILLLFFFFFSFNRCSSTESGGASQQYGRAALRHGSSWPARRGHLGSLVPRKCRDTHFQVSTSINHVLVCEVPLETLDILVLSVAMSWLENCVSK